MKKNILIARSNLRRAKGQTAAAAALMLLASLTLNLWLMLSLDYRQNFDRYHLALNAEHVTMALDSRDGELRDFVAETLEGDGRTTQYCMDDALAMVGSLPFNGGTVNTNFVIQEKQAALNRSVGRVEIVEEGSPDSGIYLPLIYGSDNSLSVGETVRVKIGNHTVDYTICGFLNSVMTGSHNCSMCSLLLTEDKYRELEELGLAPRATLISVRIDDKSESEAFEAALKNAVSSRYPALMALSNSYSLISSSRYISQMICSGIVSAMAFLTTLIALVVISSNVINYIQENMPALGALKAVGYRSRQIVFTLLLQFLGVVLLSDAAGIGLSYCLFPSVNAMMISQTGIPYAVRFQPLPCALTLAFTGGTVSLAVWASARRIRKIEPVTALRQGVLTHNFRRNHVPLAGTCLPLQPALALKITLSGIKHNVIICITMLVLSLVVVFSMLMLRNVIVDMNPFINLVVGETADSCINVNEEREEEFLKILAGEHQVRKVYLYHTAEVRHVEGLALMALITDSFSDVNNRDVCFEGRFPIYDNETAVAAKYARENGLKIGDEITLTTGDSQADYLICGFTQISSNLGKDCLLTREGYERIGTLPNLSYYINMEDGTDIDAFHQKISGRLGSGVNITINIASIVSGSASVYVSLMTVIVIAILALSAAVIAFVLYLLVRTALNARRRSYGIMKALGFTTGQLILQTALSFMPAFVLSTAAGLALSCLAINPLVSLFLSGIGIVKCTFAVPVGFIAASGAGLTLFAFGLTCLMSLKIRKISPREMLAGD